MGPATFALIFFALVCFLLYKAVRLIFRLLFGKKEKTPTRTPSYEDGYTQHVNTYTQAEQEGMRQAKMVMDRDTYIAIKSYAFTGKLPVMQPDGRWSDMYPDIKCFKIAGINFQSGLKALVDTLLDCYLVEEPDNEFDPDAIKIVHRETKKKLGYVPAEKTDWMRSITKQQFPYPCKAVIEKRLDYDVLLDKEKEFLVGRIIVKKATASLPNNP